MRAREHLQNIVDEFMFEKIYKDKMAFDILSDDEINNLIKEINVYIKTKTGISDIEFEIQNVEGETKFVGGTINRDLHRISLILKDN